MRSSRGPDDDSSLTKVPRGESAEARLRIERGLEDATIRTASGLGDLLHGSWTAAPEVTVDGGAVTLRYPRSRRSRPGGDVITLNAAVPWDITIQGRVHGVEADLRGIRLRSLTVEGGGMSRSVILLGQPDQDVHLDLGAADRVTVRRPQEAQVRVRITGGASQVVIDDQTYRALGGETVLTTGPIVWNDYHLALTAANRLRVTTL
jgi:hypothetical protein